MGSKRPPEGGLSFRKESFSSDVNLDGKIGAYPMPRSPCKPSRSIASTSFRHSGIAENSGWECNHDKITHHFCSSSRTRKSASFFMLSTVFLFHFGAALAIKRLLFSRGLCGGRAAASLRMPSNDSSLYHRITRARPTARLSGASLPTSQVLDRCNPQAYRRSRCGRVVSLTDFRTCNRQQIGRHFCRPSFAGQVLAGNGQYFPTPGLP